MRIELQRVHFMPKELVAGVLYVSEEFGAAAHLCPCGCGNKVRTPLGPAEWSFVDTPDGPSLDPSIGNWQFACRSHYWIRRGQIEWARRWSEAEIAAGRRRDRERLFEHYESSGGAGGGLRILRWLRRLFNW